MNLLITQSLSDPSIFLITLFRWLMKTTAVAGLRVVTEMSAAVSFTTKLIK